MTSEGKAPSVVGIGVVGDYRAGHETHVATSSALAHAGSACSCEVHVVWLATPELLGATSATLAGFDGLLVAPGSPYRSLERALRAIEVARTAGIPLLGTCGGFQHIVLEYARPSPRRNLPQQH